MPQLITTLGPLGKHQLGRILPHEHVFVDLRTWDQPGYGEADAEAVVRLMAPEIEAVQAQGITAIVEPSGIGVGRRGDLLLAVSRATLFPLVAPTGVYREPWLPPWVREMSQSDLAALFVSELTDQIENTGVRAGWIKVAASDGGVTAAEAHVLRAAATASARTGATIGSHTLRGEVARHQLDVLETEGADPRRFVWIHANQEPDVAIHKELAARGAWIEYDNIGTLDSDDRFVALIHTMLDAGYRDQILLSQDRGWYDPAQPGGGTPKPFTYLLDVFIPGLIASGVDEATVEHLLQANPFAAFAR